MVSPSMIHHVTASSQSDPTQLGIAASISAPLTFRPLRATEIRIGGDCQLSAVRSRGPNDAGVNTGRRSAATPPFNNLELLTVGIGQRDRLPYLASRGWIAWLCKVVFGFEQPMPLADSHLESLRTLVLALRRRRRSPWREINAALEAGVTEFQVNYLLNEFGTFRAGWKKSHDV